MERKDSSEPPEISQVSQRTLDQIQAYLGDPTINDKEKKEVKELIKLMLDTDDTTREEAEKTLEKTLQEKDLTPAAKQAIINAEHEARGLDHNYIGTEHLLLGLASSPETKAGKTLLSFRITPDKVRDAIVFIVGKGNKPPIGERIELTPRARAAIRIAGQVHRANQNTEQIDTDHLLAGLTSVDGIGAAVLETLGVRLTEVQLTLTQQRPQ